MKWTNEQAAFIAACGQGEAISLRSVAGSGKTVVLAAGVGGLSTNHSFASIICVAFNKSIATELGTKMPPTVDCRTMNSVGHRAWQARVDKKLELNNLKTYDDAKALWGEGFFFSDEFNDVPRLVGLGKQNGLQPTSEDYEWMELVDHFDLMFDDDKVISQAIYMARELLTQSIKQAKQGMIDFNDQLYMPVCFGGHFEQSDFVLIDEAQDISGIQRRMLSKMLRNGGQLIAVGDPQQAIYGFRGADSDSMIAISRLFRQQQMNLTYSFRCSKAVVREAQSIVPDIKYPDDAREGSVIELREWQLDSIEHDAVILCRNTKPLVDIAFRLIRRRVSCYILGRDIGAGLNRLIDLMRVKDLPALGVKLEAWKRLQVERCRRLGNDAKAEAIIDKVETINIIADSITGDVAELKKQIKVMFSEPRSGVCLSTIHKYKGLEANKIYFLDRHLLPSRFAQQPWQLQQEENLVYVGVTRAKRDLVYITSEGAR